VYFVVDGRIRLYRLAPSGEEVFQGELGPGDCLKCPKILFQHECHGFAEAIVDTTLEVLSKPLFDQLRRDSMLFNQILVRELSDQMADLDRRLYEYSVMPMRARLHAELLRISRRRRDGALIISPLPTHQDLARRIGSQREAVTKDLRQLERDGVITRSRAVIRIVREEVLRREIAEWNDEAAHDCRPPRVIGTLDRRGSAMPAEGEHSQAKEGGGDAPAQDCSDDARGSAHRHRRRDGLGSSCPRRQRSGAGRYRFLSKGDPTDIYRKPDCQVLGIDNQGSERAPDRDGQPFR
jgi:CRP/FNR family cyclic AMP-dependent transcriptional regulator